MVTVRVEALLVEKSDNNQAQHKRNQHNAC